MPQPIIIIPARLHSARLPQKALASIAGRPMIAHVVARALAAEIGPVLVATDTPAIAAAAEAAGGVALLTRPDHLSGSDRIAEALEHFDPNGVHKIVVNVQGDEPEIDSEALHALLEPLTDAAVDIGTLAAPLAEGEANNTNAVKVWGHAVGPQRIKATAFSRAMPSATEAWRHIGVYAYRRAALMRFVNLPPSPQERMERLEQLRALDDGMRIDVTLVRQAPRGVDTPADLAAVRARFAEGHTT